MASGCCLVGSDLEVVREMTDAKATHGSIKETRIC